MYFIIGSKILFGKWYLLYYITVHIQCSTIHRKHVPDVFYMTHATNIDETYPGNTVHVAINRVFRREPYIMSDRANYV